jgi:hypothetical protein
MEPATSFRPDAHLITILDETAAWAVWRLIAHAKLNRRARGGVGGL